MKKTGRAGAKGNPPFLPAPVTGRDPVPAVQHLEKKGRACPAARFFRPQESLTRRQSAFGISAPAKICQNGTMFLH